MKYLKVSLAAIIFMFLSVFVWGKIYSSKEPVLIKADRISDTLRIKDDLTYLTEACRYRNYKHLNSLNKAADYIKTEFLKISSKVEEQQFSVKEMLFRNIICTLGPENGERIIIGAHYDVFGDQDGADDNASGVAGLLELARLLKNQPLKYRIDLVAYANEEPPFFKSENMGSYIHAKSLFDNQISIKGMICLEMIGFYLEAKHTQRYPVFFLKWFYGSRGNYITVVQKNRNGSFGKFIKNTMKQNQVIPTKSFTSSTKLPGIDFSDHLNYWKFGYSAVMITNTAFYRNYNYHTKNDKLSTLNIGNIGLVVDEVYRTLKQME